MPWNRIVELHRLIAAEENGKVLNPMIQEFRELLAEEKAKLIETGLRKPPQSVRLRRKSDIRNL